jgi:hypothetical protein
MPTKITQKKLKSFLVDERKAVKEYKKYGFPSLARDEARHARFISKRIK